MSEQAIDRPSVGILETFGLKPLGPALKQVWQTGFGNKDTGMPGVKADLSSTNIFKPWISLPTWLGIKGKGNKAPVYILFNRNLPPLGTPFSVRVTTARDFRGKKYTYDGHEGTDFAVPVGTRLTTAAPGRVAKVVHHMGRGGWKVYMDHGQGLMTVYSHMSRVSVSPGQELGRGDVLGLSGAAGTEFLAFFPWVAPHLHFTVWLNGVPVDPFAKLEEAEVPLWRTNNNRPRPHDPTTGPDHTYTPTTWNPKRVRDAITHCTHQPTRERLEAITDPYEQAIETFTTRNLNAPLFTQFPSLYDKTFPRRPVLDLPFTQGEINGILMPDEVVAGYFSAV